MNLFSRLRKFSVVLAVFPLLLLHACASTQFSSGNQKNSLPLMEKDLLEEVHTVVVAPFFSDRNNWRGLVQEALTVPGLSVVPAGGADLSTLGPDQRRDALVRLGKSLRADTVLNGVLISREDRGEIILQLISTKDSRVLFWQAADFTHREGPIDPGAQKTLLSKMLGPVVANVAKRERPVTPLPSQQPKVTPPKIETKPETEAHPKTEIAPKTEKKPKSDKRHDKGRKPAPSSEDVSPM